MPHRTLCPLIRLRPVPQARDYQLQWTLGPEPDYIACLWSGGGLEGLQFACTYFAAFCSWRANKDGFAVPIVHMWHPADIAPEVPFQVMEGTAPLPFAKVTAPPKAYTHLTVHIHAAADGRVRVVLSGNTYPLRNTLEDPCTSFRMELLQDDEGDYTRSGGPWDRITCEGLRAYIAPNVPSHHVASGSAVLG